MEKLEQVKERLGRYQRVLGSDDAIKVLDEVDSFFGLEKNIFTVLTAEGRPHVDKAVFAKEGARAYSDALRSLIENTEEEIKQTGEIDE